jgi:DUF1680 family protein
MRITKNASYGDSMERVMYNTVLGATPLQDNGMSFYYSDYNHYAHKTCFTGYGFGDAPEWPCCSGTLPQVAADYRISAYFRDADGIYMNLFVPSRVSWQQRGAHISLTQSGTYPLGGLVTCVVTASQPSRFSLRIRIPAWTEQPVVRVNGNRLAAVEAGSFATIRREWKSGDRIELEFPRKIELKAVDAGHPDLVAVTYGPLVLFALNTEPPRLTRQQLLAARRVSPDASEWRVDLSDGSSLRLLPFWGIKYEQYSTYVSIA